jgi:hypothetical protein
MSNYGEKIKIRRTKFRGTVWVRILEIKSLFFPIKYIAGKRTVTFKNPSLILIEENGIERILLKKGFLYSERKFKEIVFFIKKTKKGGIV